MLREPACHRSAVQGTASRDIRIRDASPAIKRICCIDRLHRRLPPALEIVRQFSENPRPMHPEVDPGTHRFRLDSDKSAN